MFTRKIKLVFFVIVLLFVVGCSGSADSGMVESVPAEAEIAEEAAEEVEVELGELINPVAILVIDDFGPRPFDEAAFLLQDLAVAEINAEGVVVEEEVAPEVEVVPGVQDMVLATDAFIDRNNLLKTQAFLGAEFLLNQDVCLITPHGVSHYTLDGLRSARGRAMGDLPPELQIEAPHGELVFDQLQTSLVSEGNNPELKSSLVGYELFDDMEWLRDVELWEVDEGHLLLAQIDSYGFTTDVIDENIQIMMLDVLTNEGSMQHLGNGLGFNLGPAKGAVLNMSFALIPCDFNIGEENQLMQAYFTAFENNELGTLEIAPQALEIIGEEFTELFDAPPEETDQALNNFLYQPESAPILAQEAFRTAVINQVYGPNLLDMADFSILMSECDENAGKDIDPLCRVLDSNYGIPVIPVAAAGNSGLEFPFFPAAWGSTVSVGSTGADYSNRSEVTVPGTYMLHHDDGSIEEVEGTSFAVPRFSRLAALHLLRGGSTTCAGDVGSATPPLGYARLTEEADQWGHLALEQAIEKFCDGFPND